MKCRYTSATLLIKLAIEISFKTNKRLRDSKQYLRQIEQDTILELLIKVFIITLISSWIPQISTSKSCTTILFVLWNVYYYLL